MSLTLQLRGIRRQRPKCKSWLQPVTLGQFFNCSEPVFLSGHRDGNTELLGWGYKVMSEHILFICSDVHLQILSSTDHHTPGTVNVRDSQEKRTDVFSAFMTCIV